MNDLTFPRQFNGVRLYRLALRVGEPFSSNLVRHIGQSLSLQTYFSDFTHAALFRNQSALKLTVVDNEGYKFLTFYRSKIYGRDCMGARTIFSGVGKFTGVARIFSGVHFFPQKSAGPFLVVALKAQAKSRK